MKTWMHTSYAFWGMLKFITEVSQIAPSVCNLDRLCVALCMTMWTFIRYVVMEVNVRRCICFHGTMCIHLTRAPEPHRRLALKDLNTSFSKCLLWGQPGAWKCLLWGQPGAWKYHDLGAGSASTGSGAGQERSHRKCHV